MHERQFQQFRERFFEALDARQLDTCRQLLAEMRGLPLNPNHRRWLDYYQSILLVETSPPRWDQAERLLIPLLDANIDPELQARVLLELGINADFQGDCPQAVERYLRSLSLFEQLGDVLYQAKVLKNLGIAYTRGYELAQFGTAELEKALACHQRSLGLCQALGQEWLAATVQGMMGTVYKALGQWDQALEQYRARAAVCRRPHRRYSLGLALNNMGEVYQRKQVWNWATRCYRQALTIVREFNDLYEQADVLANLASLRRDQGRLQEAEDLYGQAIAAVESIRVALSAEGARLGFFGTEIHVYEGRLRLALEMGRVEEAFATLERAKSRAFVELLAHRPLRPPRDVPPEWLEQERHLRRQLDTLYRQKRDTPTEDAAVTRLEKKLDELRYKIGLRNAEYTSFQTVDPLDLGTVQERLPDDALLLEYFVTNDNAGVFLVSHEGLNVVPLPVTLSALRRAFASERQVLTHLTADRNGRLHQPWPLAELHRLLIEPIVEHLRNWRLLCIVPHGPLHYIPFHALYSDASAKLSTSQDGQQRYLLDGADILYAPSATVLLEYCRRKVPSKQTGGLVLAYGGGPSTSSGQALRHVEQEGRSVAGILGGRLYADDQARRAVIYKEADRYRFLHFACHGRFNPRFPLASGLMLADGILDTLDVLQRVRLDAELVALSGCETGQSALRRGDELIGLVRAFIYAGTPSVLVSLWPVDDLSTRFLMERFYWELTTEDGVTKAEALRRAQRYLMTLTETEVRGRLGGCGLDGPAINLELDRLRQAAGKEGKKRASQERPFAHPYYWAPFLLIGDRL
jgi:CHAT domain-containing protein